MQLSRDHSEMDARALDVSGPAIPYLGRLRTSYRESRDDSDRGPKTSKIRALVDYHEGLRHRPYSPMGSQSV